MKKLFFVWMCAVSVWYGTTETINIEKVRDLALANATSLKKYNLMIKSNALDEKSETYTLLPSLSLGASASMNVWGERTFQDSLSTGINFSITQKLWNGGKHPVQQAINAITSEITRKEALAEYFAVLDAADTAYYGVLDAAAALDAANSALETAQLSLSIAEVRFENRIISYGDYLQVLAEKETRETARNQAKREVTINTAKLRNLTGLKELPELEAVDFTAYEELIQKLANLSDKAIDDLYTKLWKIIEARNPMLIRAGLSSQKAEEAVNLAKKEYLPTVSASLSTGLTYSYTNGLEQPTGKLTLSANIPLDFWITANNVEKKRTARDETVLDYRNTQNALEIEIQTYLLDAIGQTRAVISSRKAYEYAQKHFEYVMELYRLSQNSISVLSDATALVISSRNQLIKSQFNFLLSLSKIRSLGTFDHEAEIIAVMLEA